MNNHPPPPKLILRFFRWFCHPDLAKYIEGDLIELFETNVKEKGLRKAKWLFNWDVVKLFRPGIIKNFENDYHLDRYGMLKNYMKSAWRNFQKHKGFSIINISSLAIGIGAIIIIYLFIQDELSFDQQHTQKQSLYRLCEIQSFPGTNTQNVALSKPSMGPSLLTDFPEVLNYSRFWGRGAQLWELDNKKLKVEKSVFVDSTFLELFDFNLIQGDRTKALNDPNSIVINETIANHFFGSNDAVGQALKWGEQSFKITGVIEDTPENSHLQFDLLVSITTRTVDDAEFNTKWGSNFLVTYLKLTENPDLQSMKERFPEYMARNSGDDDINDYMKLFVQPLSDVHLASMDIEHDYHNYRKFNGSYIGLFTLIGVFILIIASINFMNLTTARAAVRFKEVGIRKVIGGLKSQLFGQFIFESVLMAMLALSAAIFIDLLALPFLNKLISRNFLLSTVLFSPISVGVVLLSTVILGVLSGLYPALYLSSFKPINALKGMALQGKKSLFRSSLVIVQFSMSIAMIVCTVVVIQQLFYMKDKDIGFNKDHIMLLPMNQVVNKKFEIIKQELQQQSNVLGVTASGQRLGNNFHQWGFKAEVDTGMLSITPSNVHVDYDYLDVYGIRLKAGRSFSKDFATDDGLAFIINEAFAKELGYEEPIGKRVGHGWYPNDSLGTIIGVTEDFNFNSLHYKVNTLSLVVHSKWGYDEMSVKLNGANIKAGIKQVEDVWNQHIADTPFEYEFLDAHFETMYKSDDQMGAVVTIIAILSILISCMGLFGLAAISMKRRIKEIGVRKVLGASNLQLLSTLSQNYVQLILISFLIAAPITYLFLSDWLNNFAFRVQINPIIFVLAGLLTLIIAIGTIGYQTLKTASTNPVDSLRNE